LPGATCAATIGVLESVLTILFAIAPVHERLTAFQWLGVTSAAASLLVMEVPRQVR